MSRTTLAAGRVVGATLLVGLALFCGYGFLASYELGFPNVFHALYGATGVGALLVAAWLVWTEDPHRQTFWRPARLAALFCLFSLLAIPTGNLLYLGFLLFLLFLAPPFPVTPRAQP
jgi:hypothetical protein